MHPDKDKFVIWSNSCSIWVGPEGKGYAPFFHLAGRFTREEVDRYLAEAQGCLTGDDGPMEVALRIAEIIEAPRMVGK